MYKNDKNGCGKHGYGRHGFGGMTVTCIVVVAMCSRNGCGTNGRVDVARMRAAGRGVARM